MCSAACADLPAPVQLEIAGIIHLFTDQCLMGFPGMI
jgi:hypothetical protein